MIIQNAKPSNCKNDKNSRAGIDGSNFNTDLPFIRSHSNAKTLQEQMSTNNITPIN